MAEVGAVFGAEAGAVVEEPPRRNVSPGEEIIVCTPDRVLSRMRWGIIPVGRKNARGRPVMETIINARSETLFEKSAFEGLKRAVVPADGWYEWTGEKRKKTAWRIKRPDGGLLFFAAVYDIWTAPSGKEVPQVATVTCEPSGDVKDIHHRMGVLLHEDDLDTWLAGDLEAAQSLCVPYPDGSLEVEAADDVDWDKP